MVTLSYRAWPASSSPASSPGNTGASSVSEESVSPFSLVYLFKETTVFNESIAFCSHPPRCQLKAKTVTKILKALGRMCKTEATEDSLCLVLLLARTQGPGEGGKLVQLVAVHEPVVRSMVLAASQHLEEDTVETLDSLVYSLAVVAETLVPEGGELKVAASQEETSVLALLCACSSVLPLSEETAERLADTVLAISNSLGEDVSQLAEVKKTLAEIRSTMERLNPVTHQSRLAKLGDADIMFVPGHEAPSQPEVEVARIVASDPLVNCLADRLLLGCTDRKAVKKIMKKNMSRLGKVLGATPQFLLSQLERDKVEVLLLNLLRVGEQIPEIQQGVLRHLCSSSMASPSLQPSLELLLLPILLTAPQEIVQEILTSHFASCSPLLSLLSSLSPSSSMFHRALTQKLSLLLSPSHLDLLLSHPLLRTSCPLATLLLRLAPLLVARPEQDWAPALAQLLSSTLKHLHVTKGEKKDSDQTEVKEEKSNVDLVSDAAKEGKVAWSAVLDCVSVLEDKSADQAVLLELLLLVQGLQERKMVAEAEQVVGVLRQRLAGGFLSFLLSRALTTDCTKLVVLCLHQADLCLSSLPPAQLRQQDPDLLLLHTLHFLLSPQTRLQKQAYRLLPPLATATQQQGLKQLAEFFMTNKAEIINNVDNLGAILQRDGVPEEVCTVLLDHCLTGQVQLFVRMSPFFERLQSASAAHTVCKLGLRLLEEGSARNTAALGELVTRLTPLLVKHLSSCLPLLTSCLASSLIVEVAGISRPLPHLLLRHLASCPATGLLQEKQAASILSLVIKAGAKAEPAEASRVVVAAKVNPAAFLAELHLLWGKETFQERSRGRQEVSQEVWSTTCWLLETLERVLDQPSDWSLLAKPVFVLLRRASEQEVEEGTYRLSLLLTVLLKLLTSLPDAVLKKLDSKQLEPELLVTCIRTSPNPDTRNTALRVLARCALADPDFILHNSITIFTFMGSHLLQVDSKRSFQVACEALQVLVPAMKTACEAPGRQGRLGGSCLGVLTTFVDSSKDIPGHRLTEFMVLLLRSLGQQEYLWVGALLLARRKGGERWVAEIFCRFPPVEGVEALLRVMVNTRSDTQQLRKMFQVAVDRRQDSEKPDDWDLARLRALQLTTGILQDKAFRTHVGSLVQGEQEEEDIMEMINLLIEATILTVQQYSSLSTPMPPRLKKNLVAQAEKVLEQALSLLPPDTFLQLASTLLASPSPTVRLRALEVVSSKLTPPCALPPPALPPLLAPLVQLALTEEHPHTQQLALLAVRQLAKLVPEPALLQEAAEAFSCSFLEALSNPKVLGAAVLCCGDLLTALGPLAVTRVPLLVKWLLARLEQEKEPESWQEKEVAVVRNSCLYCLQKLVEGFVGFLSPLLGRIIILSCRLAGLQGVTSGRAVSLLSCLAASVPPHTVLGTGTALLEQVWVEPSAVPPFVGFVAETCRRLERGQLASVSKEVVGLFTVALSYRSREGREQAEAKVEEVEQAVITSFLSVALRLSLEDFKPVYQRLVTQHQEGGHEQLTTLFCLTLRVAERLKSLFSFGLESTVVLVTSSLITERPPGLVRAALASLAALLSYVRLEEGGLSLQQYEKLVTCLLSPHLLPDPGLPAALAQLAASTGDHTHTSSCSS